MPDQEKDTRHEQQKKNKSNNNTTLIKQHENRTLCQRIGDSSNAQHSLFWSLLPGDVSNASTKLLANMLLKAISFHFYFGWRFLYPTKLPLFLIESMQYGYGFLTQFYLLTVVYLFYGWKFDFRFLFLCIFYFLSLCLISFSSHLDILIAPEQ